MQFRDEKLVWVVKWAVLLPFLYVGGCVPDALLQEQEKVGTTDHVTDTAKNDDLSSLESGGDDSEDGCKGWKFAYCDAIEACSAFVSREQCELDLGWLVCKSDAPLDECQKAIKQALKDKKCENLPTECGPQDIADRTLATQLCENIHTEMCEYRFFCGLEFSAEACMQSLSLTEACDSFTSFLPTAVDCAEAYKKLGCESAMPQVCAGSLRR